MAHQRIRKFNSKDTYPEQKLDNDLCQGVVARGATVFLRGQVSQDLDTRESLHVGDATAQTAKTMANIKMLMDEACSRAGKTPDGPLHLILYLDGVTPGNVLRPDNRRKIWSFYASFREFGWQRLCYEECWLPLAVLRSNMEHDITGRVSNAMRLLMGNLAPLATHGVILHLLRPTVVFIIGRRGQSEGALQ